MTTRAPLTAKGAQRLRAELDELKSVKRPAIIEAIAEARAHGDLRENAEYHAAREQQSFTEGRIVIHRGADGHYHWPGKIDGHAVDFLVDTGASVVALTRQDAAALGLNPAADQFTVTVQTAAGTARAAPVQLAQIAVGDAKVERVTALVVENGLPHSLLGMSYLGRLNGFQAGPDGLTLKHSVVFVVRLCIKTSDVPFVSLARNWV